MSTLRSWPSSDIWERINNGALKDTDLCPGCDCPAGVHRRALGAFLCPPVNGEEDKQRYRDMVMKARTTSVPTRPEDVAATLARKSWPLYAMPPETSMLSVIMDEARRRFPDFEEHRVQVEYLLRWRPQLTIDEAMELARERRERERERLKRFEQRLKITIKDSVERNPVMEPGVVFSYPEPKPLLRKKRRKKGTALVATHAPETTGRIGKRRYDFGDEDAED